MRDILVHAYFGVVLERVWIAVRDDLPALKEKIIRMVKDLDKNVTL